MRCSTHVNKVRYMAFEVLFVSLVGVSTQATHADLDRLASFAADDGRRREQAQRFADDPCCVCQTLDLLHRWNPAPSCKPNSEPLCDYAYLACQLVV